MINRMFVQNQKGVYQQMDSIKNINNKNLKGINNFGVIWNNEKEHQINGE